LEQRLKTVLKEICGEGVRFGESMKKYTTLGVGGKAECLCFVKDLETLRRLCSLVQKEKLPCLVVGRGSNLLVRDGGIKGLVILLEGRFSELDEEGDGRGIKAGGGTPIQRLLAFATERGLGGLEFLAGIPGTLGGAVAMNAGAWGHDIGSRVRAVEIVMPGGETVALVPPDLRFSYRAFSLPEGAVIFRVSLEVVREDRQTVSHRIADYLKRRREKQPLRYPSAGSVFKNPPGLFAGKLIEEAGLKGKRMGDAMISGEHANFIVNTGSASAEDVLTLMEMARRAVRELRGVELEPEIRIVGEGAGKGLS